jgi:hypothetical protein
MQVTLKERNHLGDLGIGERIILKWALDKYEGISKSFRGGGLEGELQMVQLCH